MRPTLPSAAQDDLIALAMALSGAAYAHLHLTGDERGLPFDYLVAAELAPVQIPALARDARFAGHALVQRGPRYASYLGVPILTATGALLGVLSVLGQEERQYSAHEISLLERLARTAVPQVIGNGGSEDAASLVMAAFEASPFATGIVELHDDDILQLYQNRANVRLNGGEERAGMFFLKRAGFPAKMVDAWREGYAQCLRQQKPLNFDYERAGPAGTLLPVRTYLAHLGTGPSGAPRFMFKTFEISEEREKDRAFEEQRKLLASIAAHLQLTIWVRDLRTNGLIFVSPHYEKMWGRSCESLVANHLSFLEGVHPDDRDRVVEALESAPERHYDLTYRVLTPEGELRWVHDEAFPIRDVEGNLIQIMGVATDVTKDRQRERELLDVNDNLEVVLTHLPVALSVFDEGGQRIRVNREWERITGYTASAVHGRDVMPMLFETPEELEAVRRFVRSNDVMQDFKIRTQSGERKEISVTMVPLPSGKKVSLTRDLTYERAQAKLIEDQRQSLVEAARFSSLGEMAAGIAHEINNPLAIIQGSAQLLLTALETNKLDEEKLRRSVERIDVTVTRIAKIISGLRSLARDGRADPPVRASLKTIIDESLELCESRFRNNGVDLQIDLPVNADTPLLVLARPTQLSQVIINLLNNAFDAVSGQENKALHLRLREDDKFVVLQVLDNGPGVPAELREKIMQPFFTTKAPGKGTGLGLSLSRSIVEKHGGTLKATTFRGLTCFEIRLPRALAQTEAA